MLHFSKFIFLVVLAVYFGQCQGSPIHDIKDDKLEKIPAALIPVKIGIAKAVAAKIKLAAFKKWAAVKTIVKAPFILGKKAVILKVGAVKGLAALKVGAVKGLAALKIAKAKKILGLAKKKVAPAVAAVAAIPAAAAAAIKPAVDAIVIKPETEVVDVYEIPVSGTHYQVAQPNAHFSASYVGTYKDGLDTPRTYSNGYSVSLLPEGEVSNTYQFYPVSDASQGSGIQVVGNAVTSDTNANVIVPHDTYGVPN